MKCPKCNKEMKQGYIRPTGNGGICWTNDKDGAPAFADGFFRIGKSPYLGRESIPACNCESCETIIIDYSAYK